VNDPAVQRIGVFGGAFDPPHRAHVALALAALQQLGLDQLRIVPTGTAWHKSRGLTPAQHRLAMARLAFGPLEKVVVDEREICRSGPSYTVDTLREILTEFPLGELFLVLGEDQAAAFNSWHESATISQLAIICVAGRVGIGRVSLIDDVHPANIPESRRLSMAPDEVSATLIRQRLAQGDDIAGLVFEPVARYIERHHLYQND
jgi:nicotinate-nucleotide adenylyltransferase